MDLYDSPVAKNLKYKIEFYYISYTDICIFIFRNDSSENEKEESIVATQTTVTTTTAKKRTRPHIDSLLKEDKKHDKVINKILEEDDDEDDLYFQACARRIRHLYKGNKSWLKFKIEENFMQAEAYQEQQQPRMLPNSYAPVPFNNAIAGACNYNQFERNPRISIKPNQAICITGRVKIAIIITEITH